MQLLDLHRQEMLKHSPPEHVHALELHQLKEPSLTFWRVLYEGEFAACGAIKQLSETHGEVKSMKTKDEFLRKGIAKALLLHLIAESQARGYSRLSLETGSMDAFIPARRLYSKLGFAECTPFADYTANPLSVCMTRHLD